MCERHTPCSTGICFDCPWLNEKHIVCCLILLLQLTHCNSVAGGNDPTIIDSRHYSTVFGEVRNYRIFLPSGYYDNVKKRYPVIYFLHGWSQRYFGNSGEQYSGLDFDKGDDNKGDNIEKFVSANDVIVVKPDGYNRSPHEDYYLRPYNVGPVESFRQFPVYFPELVEHIDSRYNTMADRGHRGVCGLSMGGFMTYWIAGKYPHLVSAAGNFCGAVEYMVGPKDFSVEYRILDHYKNYKGLNVRLNYGDKDYIRNYHQDMIGVWQQVMDNFEYKIYEGYHSTVGLSEMLTFMLNTFANPPRKPERWDHIDVYPEFSVWDYQVSTDRAVPGFTILENVDKRGFRCSVREFLPDGELMPYVNLQIITAPLFERNQWYTVNDVDTRTLKTSQKSVRSDNTGRLKILINGSTHEIGINRKTDRPNISIASVEIQNMPWATHKKEVKVSIKLLNKGSSNATGLSATLSATKTSAKIIQGKSKFGRIDINEMQPGDMPFVFVVMNDSIEIEKFKLTVRDAHNEWIEYFEIVLKKDSPEMKDVVVADGKMFTVVSAGVDTKTMWLGNGNGDGVANPGESIVILVKEDDKYWRTDLTFSDRFVNPFGVNIRNSDNWTEFDHVGASMKYDIPLIASDCPENHRIDVFAEYFEAEYPFHVKHQGKVSIEVKGTDTVSPLISWVQIPGDNLIQVKVYDGSGIASVKAKFILKTDPARFFEEELNDDGTVGDHVADDNVFSKKIDEQAFGIYRVVVEATDTHRNKLIKEMPGTYVLY